MPTMVKKASGHRPRERGGADHWPPVIEKKGLPATGEKKGAARSGQHHIVTNGSMLRI